MANLTRYVAGEGPNVNAATLNGLIGIREVDTVAELEDLTNAQVGERIYVGGYYAAGDGGNIVCRRTNSGATVNGVTVFSSADGGTARWHRDDLP